MREVRMTFGEHLEELRRRIIFSLLYLAVGVAVSMAYGTQLMEWTLRPHYRALGAAQQNRLIARMEKTVAKLDHLTSVVPLETLEEGNRLLEGEIHWEVLFLREVALPELYRRLEAPYATHAEALRASLSSLPEAERAGVAKVFLDLGSDVSRVLVAEFASELEREDFARIPERFQALADSLGKAQGSVAPSKIQTILGWGKDLGTVLSGLQRFQGFLELRRREALQSDVSIDKLRQWAQASNLPRTLGEILDSLEADAKVVKDGTQPRIWVISYMESFSSYLRVALIIGALIALPGILYEMWKFIGAGLYSHEQKYVVTFLPFSMALFAAGIAFGYFIMIPVGLEFLAGWGVEDAELSFTLGSYVGLFFTLTLILGLVFQTPLVMVFLAKIGLMSVALYRKYRRVAILVGVILAVVLTPPDPFSWSLMAAPMILLYEVGILACVYLGNQAPTRSGG